MTIRMQDIGEFAYGGAVTLGQWWDAKRVKDGTLQESDVFKKAGFWAYLGIGLPATLMSALGWWRRYETWAEHISHGFLFYLPSFMYQTMQSLKKTATTSTDTSAVREAQRLIQERARLNAANPTARSYQPEFKKTLAL